MVDLYDLLADCGLAVWYIDTTITPQETILAHCALSRFRGLFKLALFPSRPEHSPAELILALHFKHKFHYSL